MLEQIEHVKFGDLYEVPSRNGVSYPSRLRGTGIPMVNMRELFAFDRIYDQDMERVPLTDKELRDALLREGDLLFARQSLVREGAGRVVYVEHGGDRTWEGHLIRVRLDRSRAVPRYFYYYFRSKEGRALVETIVEQVAAAGIRGSDLARLPVPVPPVKVQLAVSASLGSLDDKIEADRRLITSLDEMIALTFEFQMNRPNDDPMSEWPKIAIGDAVEVRGGSTPRTSNPDFWSTEGFAWATPRDLSRLSSSALFDTERHITEAGLRQISSGLLPAGAVLLSSRAPIGYTAIAEVPVAVNQGFIALVCDQTLPNLYVWQWIRSHLEDIKARANGTTFLEISKTNFRPMLIPVPPSDLVDRWVQAARPMYELLVNTEREVTVLRNLRESLLPKLLSGELRIRDPDDLVEVAV